MSQMNYVGRLNEYRQKHNLSLQYVEVSAEGPDHVRQFTMKVVLDSQAYPDGVGMSKREAKQNAAKNALEKLWVEVSQQNDPVNSSRESSCPSPVSTQGINHLCWLNEYGQKKGVLVQPFERSDGGPPHMPQFSCRFAIGNRNFPEAFGKNKKDAKKEAAKLAYEALQEKSTPENLNGNHNKDTPSSSRNLPSMLSSTWLTPPSSSPESTPESRPSTSSTSSSTGTSSPSAHMGSSILTTPERLNRDDESDYIIFRDSSDKKVQSPGERKPKFKLAAVFRNESPEAEKNKQSTAPGLNKDKPSCKDHAESTQSSRFLQDFDLIETIDKGGFGSVFKARRKLEGKHYAVKIVKHTPKAEREVGALAGLQHQYIVRYFSSWLEDTMYQAEKTDSSSSSSSGPGTPKEFLYIQMELCEGGTLRSWIDQEQEGRPKDKEKTMSIFRQIVEGVKYIHSKQLIHRDLKPPNILFSHERTVKIGDFGLATSAINESDSNSIQRTKRTGTVTYMSPEQETQNQYGEKVDIFPLGLIFFELLWRFKTKTERQKTWHSIRNREFPSEFCKQHHNEHKLIEQMLSQEPEERPEASKIAKNLKVLLKSASELQDSKTI
ncbi:interferon-induced, double-stranded RNA-activated protein kinase isoform X1 [Lepisosteus oculatus]|uniref:interferon-induced, double-stranded RNA-activated protein kinase isoform X1 n=1 Tax=Lepisosteus oculatus TaxID=7918 RepID=UPI0035F5193A